MKRGLFLLSSLALLASLMGGAAVLHQNRIQTFGVVSGLPDPDLDPRPNLFAINVALEQYDDLEPPLDLLPGFHWLRQTFPWSQIEPRRGEYDWARWDAIVAAARAHQKEIIAVLHFSPAWAAEPPSHPLTQPPGDPQDFAAFASTFATRYADSIDVYQIWDEPNLLSGWGGQPPSAAGYLALLQGAYTAIHQADPTATVLAAALAPTVETGLDNISDVMYLQQLYDLGAGPYFEAAAGKPYGFYSGPDDRTVDPKVLNFSRFTLLRQVMERNGDGHKLLWGGNFGWNTRPDSPWGFATPDQQLQYTLAAYDRALNEWPWAGPLALDTFQPALPPADPHWGFALIDPTRFSIQPTPLLVALNSSPPDSAAFPGNYPARHPAARYVGDWEFSDLGADIPEHTYNRARIEFTFQGTELGLKVRRGDYRGYLYVEVDGQPANLLPRDDRGAYLVLTAPRLEPEVVTLPVASGLSPDQIHTAVIRPERGWDQWAMAGFSVGRRTPDGALRLALSLLAAVASAGLVGATYLGRGLDWGPWSTAVRTTWKRLGDTGQLLLTAIVGGLLYLSSWLAFGDEALRVTRRFGDALPIALTALTAGLFYFSPSLIGALIALGALFVLFYLRLDLALAFAALFIPFYLQPRLLWERGFSLVETTVALAIVAWTLLNLRSLLVSLRSKAQSRRSPALWSLEFGVWSSIDWAVLAFFLISTLSLFTAELKGVALREYRLVIVAPTMYYVLVRTTPLDRAALWRIVDFFLLGAVLVAGVGLYQYVTGSDLITAEGGLARIRSVYGSPNNLALYLGRALPIATAVAILSADKLRRWLYLAAALVFVAALLLTFSKGALFLGAPVALAVILVGWLGRRGLTLVGVGALASLGALPVLSRIPRFADLLDFGSGTSFFRVKLWVSAWRMWRDHPWFGVGLDNFLYQYRGRYILPEAWEDPNLSHPHNIALDYLSRLGLLGFACGVWLQAGFWRIALDAWRKLSLGLNGTRREGDRELRALCLGLMGSAADMLAHGLVDHSFFLLDLAFVFFLTLALVQHMRRLAL
jgi:O-antigen ligase